MSRPLTEDEFHFACSVNERGRRAQRLGRTRTRTRRASRSRRGSGADAPSTGAAARSGYGALWDAAGAIAEGGAASASAAEAAAAETGPGGTGKDREGEGEGDDGLAGDELLDFGEFVVLEVRFASMPDSLPRGSLSLSGPFHISPGARGYAGLSLPHFFRHVFGLHTYLCVVHARIVAGVAVATHHAGRLGQHAGHL